MMRRFHEKLTKFEFKTEQREEMGMRIEDIMVWVHNEHCSKRKIIKVSLKLPIHQK